MILLSWLTVKVSLGLQKSTGNPILTFLFFSLGFFQRQANGYIAFWLSGSNPQCEDAKNGVKVRTESWVFPWNHGLARSKNQWEIVLSDHNITMVAYLRREILAPLGDMVSCHMAFYAPGLKGPSGASSNQIVLLSVRLSIFLSVCNYVPLTKCNI